VVIFLSAFLLPHGSIGAMRDLQNSFTSSAGSGTGVDWSLRGEVVLH
jgi:hypothetical protein